MELSDQGRGRRVVGDIDSTMDVNQLIHTLSAHISLYSSSISSSSPLCTTPRASILKWFTSLSVPQRQASLTIVDHKFTQVLLLMVNRLRRNGHGFFILLPDLPHLSLPTICFRRSHGILSRSSASNESEIFISRSILLFSSTEGTDIFRKHFLLDNLDSCTASEEMVSDAEKFVAAMDHVSNRRFLRGEAKDIGADWLELPWLKEKGYYSLEAFLANKLEIALRLSWMNHNGAKRRGSKAKDKVSGTAGVAANAFWRKKGCLDWWEHLDIKLRENILKILLCKMPNLLVRTIVKEEAGMSSNLSFSINIKDRHHGYKYIPSSLHGLLEIDGCSLNSPPSSPPRRFGSMHHFTNGLLVLQEISFMMFAFDLFSLEKDILFFSNLNAPYLVMGRILMWLREFLAHISSEYAKLELFDDGLLGGSQARCKKKGKGKGLNSKNLVPESTRSVKQTKDDLGQVSRKTHAKFFSSSDSKEVTLPVRGNGGKKIEHRKSHIKKAAVGTFKQCIVPPASSEQPRMVRNSEGTAIAGICQESQNVCKEVLETSHSPICESGSVERAPTIKVELPTGKKEDKKAARETDGSACSDIHADKGPHDLMLEHWPNESEYQKEGKNIRMNGNSDVQILESDCCSIRSVSSFAGSISYDFPSRAPIYFSPSLTPVTTDRLHIDVGSCHANQSVIPAKDQFKESCTDAVSAQDQKGSDCPLLVDSGYKRIERISMDLGQESENPFWKTEEFEIYSSSSRDYNKFFGGGVMFWNSSDQGNANFSRPPSLSSEDGSWAWHEADINKAIDDIVDFSSSCTTNGLASPTSVSVCSRFDPLLSAHQQCGYLVQGDSVVGKDVVAEESGSIALTNSARSAEDGLTRDMLPYSFLRPIIVPNLSNKTSQMEFKCNREHTSPYARRRKEMPHSKRPPSPVVLCVPPASRFPASSSSSSIDDSRKQRDFPSVRSGSSSPRNWGLRSRYQPVTTFQELRPCMDGIDSRCSSWRSNGFVLDQVPHPLQGSCFQDRLITVSPITFDHEHPDVALPLQPSEMQASFTIKPSLTAIHDLLHEEIESFCKKQVFAKNIVKKPYINWAVQKVARSLQVLWPRSRTNVFGSSAIGMALPSSDVDIVVCLPPVRNLEPIKEAGILEGRNGIKETCLQHAARYLSNQEWVKSDSLKTVENTTIPVIMLVVEVPDDQIISAESLSQRLESERNPDIRDGSCTAPNESWSFDSNSNAGNRTKLQPVRLDISFMSPSHSGLQTTELVRDLIQQLPAVVPLALVLKQFLADRSLDHAYSGGLSSYCLVLLVVRFLQHESHHARSINQNLGCLLMDFLYFFGNIFDPRQMGISIRGTGIYMKRERGQSIDPIHIDDPLCPSHNVGKNCFRIHQCIKAFADAYTVLMDTISCLPFSRNESGIESSIELLPKVIPAIDRI